MWLCANSRCPVPLTSSHKMRLMEGEPRRYEGLPLVPGDQIPALGWGGLARPLLLLWAPFYGNPKRACIFIVIFRVNEEQFSYLDVSLEGAILIQIPCLWLSLSSSWRQGRRAAISRFLLLLKGAICKRVLWGTESLPYHVWPDRKIALKPEAFVIVQFRKIF